MDLLNRVLSKAYAAPRPAEPPASELAAAEPAAAAEVLRGWVDAVRSPRHATGTAPSWAWPAICDKLLTVAGPGFQRLADQLFAARTARSRQSIAFFGAGRRSGTTSIVLTLAKLLTAHASIEILLVDAHRDHPALAERLCAAPQTTLPDTPAPDDTSPEIAIDSALVRLDGSRLSILPLAGAVTPVAPASNSLCLSIHKLRSRFDLILIDAGPCDNGQLSPLLNRLAVDAVVRVRRADDSAQLPESTLHACHNAEIEFLGTIETFSE